jgi:Carboxypeptidase regulatory-like domain/TonB dependent receptor
MHWFTSTMRRIRRASAVALIISAVPLAAWAQTAARFAGTVKDPSGATVANATVTMTNQATNVSRSAKTDNDGIYLFPIIEAGVYQVTVEHPGFKKAVQRDITLEINQNGRLDVTLELGQTSEVVEVNAAAPQIDTTGAVLGKVESERRLSDLPILDRENGTLSLGLLQAGVFAPDPDDGSGNPFSVSGQRSESLTFYVDGADNTDFLSNRIVENPIADAVQEFKILTNNYDAQFGRTSGGIVNQVIKSGTNTFHGDVFEYWRNDILNANDFFLNGAGVPRSSFKRNLFGGSLGGPVKRNKLFFFGSYEGARRREGATPQILQVLSPAERTGNFAELCPAGFDGSGNCLDINTGTQLVNPATGNNYANNQVPVNPIIANYINKYLPPPNIAGTNNFVSSPVASVRQDRFVVKTDYNLSSRDTLSFVYQFNDTSEFFPLQVFKGASTGGNVPVGSGSTNARRRQTGSLLWTHTFAGSWINQARFAANRRAELLSKPTDTTTPSALGFTNVNPDDPGGVAPPIMFTTSFNLGPSPQGPTKEHDATFQWTDDVTVTRGKHEIKFGGDVRRVRDNFNFDFFNNGSFDFTSGFTGNSLADFVGGFPDNYFQFSRAIYGIRTSEFDFYGQDTWKILPRLTINIGLRYEYNTPQRDIHNEIIGFFPGQQSTLFPNAPPDLLYAGDPNTGSKGLVFPDKNNFAPRFGFAWDIFGNAKLVMRGGGGIFYDIEDGALNLQFGGQPPFGDVISTSPGVAPTFQSGVDYIADPFGSVGLTNPFPFNSVGTFFIPKDSFSFVTFPHFRTPYSENFNFGFEYQLTKNTMIEAVYVGSLGRKLIQGEEVNFPVTSVMQQQLAQFGSVNPECARPLAACTLDGNLPSATDPVTIDPAGIPTGATSLLTNMSVGLSDSHEFQLTADKRFSHGFLFRAAYTISKTIDTTSGFRARSSVSTNPTDYRQDRALADFDTPQRFVISGLWELPWDRPFQNRGTFWRKLTAGWQVNAIATFQAGNPFTLFSNSNSSQQDQRATDGVDLDRPDLNGKISKLNPRATQTFTSDCGGGTVTGNFYIDPTVFDCSNVPIFTFGTLGRNSIRGPGINNWDLSVIKRTKLTESKTLEFRAEFFNAFNHAQFLNPDPTGGASTFGQIVQARDPRLGQLALKFAF